MDSPVRRSPSTLSASPVERQARGKNVTTKAGKPPPKPVTIQRLPAWLVRAVPQASTDGERPGAAGNTAREDAFTAGAALHALDQILRSEAPFDGVWRMRIALDAAIAASRLLRDRSDAAELRDTLHLTRAGDEPGAAGRAHALLRRFSTRPMRHATALLDTAEGPAASGFRDMLALLRQDLALAERLGWQRPLPLHVLAMHDSALRRGEGGQRIGCDEPAWESVRHAILARAAIQAHQRALTLALAAEKLVHAAASSRTRESEAGLALILGDDCVAPWRMAQAMGSDRAARRFCENLVVQGALRLLTPRATFRLYGL